MVYIEAIAVGFLISFTVAAALIGIFFNYKKEKRKRGRHYE
jgi:biotin transporter BioY